MSKLKMSMSIKIEDEIDISKKDFEEMKMNGDYKFMIEELKKETIKALKGIYDDCNIKITKMKVDIDGTD